MCTERPPRTDRQKGVTLIELIVFIIIVSVALAGVLSVLNVSVMHSSDPLVRKQALAIAESLMEEVALQPMTYCDPMDAKVTTAAPYRTAGVLDSCTVSEALGPETIGGVAQNRYTEDATHTRFNNVNDYSGFAMNGATACVGAATGICDVNGANPTANLAGYSATVTITDVGASFSAGPSAGDVLKIDVTVGRAPETITLTTYRFRYAPNSP